MKTCLLCKWCRDEEGQLQKEMDDLMEDMLQVLFVVPRIRILGTHFVSPVDPFLVKQYITFYKSVIVLLLAQSVDQFAVQISWIYFQREEGGGGGMLLVCK